MNDNTVLGGVRATESAGFKAANVIGIGINGTDAIGELKKADSGFFGLMLPSPHIEGYKTAEMMYEWITTGKEPPKRSEEHTSELQSLMRISYAVFCLKKKTKTHHDKCYKHKNPNTTK